MNTEEIARWYAEQGQIHCKNQEDEAMALSEFEQRVIDKERDRSALLQQIARLEGTMTATTKVEQSHLYDMLEIIRNLVDAR